MSKKVFANNIAQVSYSGIFSEAAVCEMGNASDAVGLIGKIATDIEIGKKVEGVTAQRQRELADLYAEYVDFVRHKVPEGFALAVMAVAPEVSNKAGLDSEYKKVEKDFIQYLGENCEHELERHGASKYTIELMKKGLLLTSVMPYEIVQKIGAESSGNFATQKEFDLNNPFGGEKVVIAHHFNNLMLMPKSVVMLNETLKKIQERVYGKVPQKYRLVLAPVEPSGKVSGFIAHKQKGFKPMSDRAVIIETIKYLDAKKGNSLLKEEFDRQALRNINEEIGLMARHAEQYSNRKMAAIVELEEFVTNDSLQAVFGRISSSRYEEAKALVKTMDKVKKLINQEDDGISARKISYPPKLKVVNTRAN